MAIMNELGDERLLSDHSQIWLCGRCHCERHVGNTEHSYVMVFVLVRHRLQVAHQLLQPSLRRILP